ncbi:MAG: Trp biosynthesis-associated membrane protein, partial [Actinomycetota bacterium]|nr:Trp biosynthesis-associated membrane protein [Actinomycetota bacterium]
MPEAAASRKELTATVALLVAAAVVLGAAAMLGWARVDFQVPKRGIVTVAVQGSEVLPALTPLAVLALAAVAAVLA